VTLLVNTLTEKNKWENVASASIKKMKGAKYEKLEETLVVWVGQLTFKHLGWYLNFSAWFMKKSVLFEQKKDKIMK
jgi:hypothetical protein